MGCFTPLTINSRTLFHDFQDGIHEHRESLVTDPVTWLAGIFILRAGESMAGLDDQLSDGPFPSSIIKYKCGR